MERILISGRYIRRRGNFFDHLYAAPVCRHIRAWSSCERGCYLFDWGDEECDNPDCWGHSYLFGRNQCYGTDGLCLRDDPDLWDMSLGVIFTRVTFVRPRPCDLVFIGPRTRRRLRSIGVRDDDDDDDDDDRSLILRRRDSGARSERDNNSGQLVRRQDAIFGNSGPNAGAVVPAGQAASTAGAPNARTLDLVQQGLDDRIQHIEDQTEIKAKQLEAQNKLQVQQLEARLAAQQQEEAAKNQAERLRVQQQEEEQRRQNDLLETKLHAQRRDRQAGHQAKILEEQRKLAQLEAAAEQSRLDNERRAEQNRAQQWQANLEHEKMLASRRAIEEYKASQDALRRDRPPVAPPYAGPSQYASSPPPADKQSTARRRTQHMSHGRVLGEVEASEYGGSRVSRDPKHAYRKMSGDNDSNDTRSRSYKSSKKKSRAAIIESSSSSSSSPSSSSEEADPPPRKSKQKQKKAYLTAAEEKANFGPQPSTGQSDADFDAQMALAMAQSKATAEAEEQRRGGQSSWRAPVPAPASAPASAPAPAPAPPAPTASKKKKQKAAALPTPDPPIPRYDEHANEDIAELLRQTALDAKRQAEQDAQAEQEELERVLKISELEHRQRSGGAGGAGGAGYGAAGYDAGRRGESSRGGQSMLEMAPVPRETVHVLPPEDPEDGDANPPPGYTESEFGY